MTEIEASERFKPYLEWFRYCFREAWEWYEKIMHPLDDPRYRSTAIQNRAVVIGRETMGQQSGIREHEFRTRRLFVLGDWGLAQFKKLDDVLHPINSPTDTSVAFDSQEEIPGLLFYPRFTVGYSPSVAHTRYSLHIIHSRGPEQNNWSIDITGNSVLVTGDLFGEKHAESSEPTRRVRIREGAISARGESATEA